MNTTLKSILLLILTILPTAIIAQSISGNLTGIKNTTIKLEGFKGLKNYTITTSSINDKGDFTIDYSKTDYGIGFLITQDNKPFLVLLTGEEIKITGESLNNIETLKIKEGEENKYFEQYAKEHPKREQALSALVYLEKLYANDSLFINQKKIFKALQEENLRITNEDKFFLENLPKNSYVEWFIPIRKLVSSAFSIAQYHPEEIPKTIHSFRNLDYTDPRLYKSGLFKDAIDNHFWLLENSGKSLDNIFEEMKLSIDAMMVKLVTNEKIFNEVTDYLFDLLEKHSLFKASEYLALKVLNDGSCTINNDLAKQLETYRAMKKGNIAPDIVFEKSNFANSLKTINKLSELKSEYTVIIFGASWCPKCNEEIPEISNLYQKWKSKNVEVVYISLEEDKNAFTNFAGLFPFPSYTDLKKWDGKIVKDFYVFSTPTIFLLDNERKIILRPNSVKQMDAWVDWKLN